MTNQFQSPMEKKVEDETVVKDSPKKRAERVAEKAAEKSSEKQKETEKDGNLISH